MIFSIIHKDGIFFLCDNNRSLVGKVSKEAYSYIKVGQKVSVTEIQEIQKLDKSDDIYGTGIFRIKGPCGHFH